MHLRRLPLTLALAATALCAAPGPALAQSGPIGRPIDWPPKPDSTEAAADSVTTADSLVVADSIAAADSLAAPDSLRADTLAAADPLTAPDSLSVPVSESVSVDRVAGDVREAGALPDDGAVSAVEAVEPAADARGAPPADGAETGVEEPAPPPAARSGETRPGDGRRRDRSVETPAEAVEERTDRSERGAGPAGRPVKALGRPVEIVDPAQTTIGFMTRQLQFGRVSRARANTDARLRTLFERQGLAYPAREIFIRVFKHERVLELWARSDRGAPFELVREYPVCALPGQLGPKGRIGDFQVPEGFYYINNFNPWSEYHLSLKINYPNLGDRLRGYTLALGGEIFIHGGCETVGCIPIENRNIEEVYWLAVQATAAGQRVIPVHVFPTRMTDERRQWLADVYDPEPRLALFWDNIAEGYRYFERTRRVPWIMTARDGSYVVPDVPERLAPPPGRGPIPAIGTPADSTGRAPHTP